MLDIKETEGLPPVRRSGGRVSEEREQIKEALQSGKPVVIENVTPGKPYNALQQRIRQAAAALGIKVYIRQERIDANASNLHFEGYNDALTNKKSAKSQTSDEN